MKSALQERLNGGRTMTQDERLDYLLRHLLAERGEYTDIRVPDDLSEKRKLLRSLMNVRPPVPVSAEFLAVQDSYLQERLAERVITRPEDLAPVRQACISGRATLLLLPPTPSSMRQTARCLAVSCPVTAVSTTLSTLMQGYSFAWNAPV